MNKLDLYKDDHKIENIFSESSQPYNLVIYDVNNELKEAFIKELIYLKEHIIVDFSDIQYVGEFDKKLKEINFKRVKAIFKNALIPPDISIFNMRDVDFESTEFKALMTDLEKKKDKIIKGYLIGSIIDALYYKQYKNDSSFEVDNIRRYLYSLIKNTSFNDDLVVDRKTIDNYLNLDPKTQAIINVFGIDYINDRDFLEFINELVITKDNLYKINVYLKKTSCHYNSCFPTKDEKDLTYCVASMNCAKGLQKKLFMKPVIRPICN